MWHALFCVLIISGVGLIYLSHKNQQILRSQLNKRPWRGVGYLVLLLVLVGELQFYSSSSAVLLWMVSIMLVLGTLPFVSLWGRR